MSESEIASLAAKHMRAAESYGRPLTEPQARVGIHANCALRALHGTFEPSKLPYYNLNDLCLAQGFLRLAAAVLTHPLISNGLEKATE